MSEPATRNDEMRRACVLYHEGHPDVWRLFVKFTDERIARGYTQYSVNAIFERIRWETGGVGANGKNTFKINNNHRPFYARRYMRMHPELPEFFGTRIQTSKEAPATNLPELGPEDFE